MIIRNGTECLIAGRLIKDAAYSQVGAKKTPLTKLSVSCSKENIVNVDVWTELARATMDLKKGDRILVAGELSSREYNGKTYWTLTADYVGQPLKPVDVEVKADDFKDIQSDDIPF